MSTGMSLEAKNISGEITGFELMDANREWHTAAAELSDSENGVPLPPFTMYNG